MSAFVLFDCSAWIDGFAATTYSNNLSLKQDIDDQDTTTFGSGGYKSRIGGLRSVDFELKGFWESPVDDTWTNLGVADRTCTVTANATEAQPAWMFQAGEFSYERGGGIGDVDPFSLKAMGTNGVGLVAGQLAKSKGDVSATGVLGSVLNLGAPTSTQYVYAVLHVFTAGTTITVQVQSDDSAGFSSATTRGTIGPITTTGGTWMTRVAGPFVGETHWRMNVSAITGTFNVAGAIGIA